MNFRELENFRDTVANPRMEQLFANTQIAENACYINHLEVSFLDGNNCGYDSLIEASGLTYRDGKVEEYHFSELDIELSEFLAAHKDSVFIQGGSLHVTDELGQMDMRTNLGNVLECSKLFPQMSCAQEMDIQDTPLPFEKMKRLLRDQQKELPSRGAPLNHLMEEAKEKAAEKNASRREIHTANERKPPELGL